MPQLAALRRLRPAGMRSGFFAPPDFAGDPKHFAETDMKKALDFLKRFAFVFHGRGWKKGFEPSTFGTTIRHSNQLSYIHHLIRYISRIGVQR